MWLGPLRFHGGRGPARSGSLRRVFRVASERREATSDVRAVCARRRAPAHRTSPKRKCTMSTLSCRGLGESPYPIASRRSRGPCLGKRPRFCCFIPPPCVLPASCCPTPLVLPACGRTDMRSRNGGGGRSSIRGASTCLNRRLHTACTERSAGNHAPNRSCSGSGSDRGSNLVYTFRWPILDACTAGGPRLVCCAAPQVLVVVKTGLPVPMVCEIRLEEDRVCLFVCFGFLWRRRLWIGGSHMGRLVDLAVSDAIVKPSWRLIWSSGAGTRIVLDSSTAKSVEQRPRNTTRTVE